MNFQKTNKQTIILFSIIFLILIGFISSLDSFGEKIIRDNYEIARDKVERSVTLGDLIEDEIDIKSLVNRQLSVSVSVSGEIADLIELTTPSLIINPNNLSSIFIIIMGRETGNFSGEISLSGDINEKLPVKISVGSESLDPLFFVETDPTYDKFKLNKFLEFKLNVNKLKTTDVNDVNFSYYLIPENSTQVFYLGSEQFNITSSFQIVKRFNFPEEIEKGSYSLRTEIKSPGDSSIANSFFILKEPFLQKRFFNFLPMWILVLTISFFILFTTITFLVKRHIKNSKKYSMEVDTKSLPKYDKTFFHLGKIAESKTQAYLEPEKLKTHCIVAGATGGGKSISAQVIIEEALMKNVAVIVFDPTAQWSGMLRKCDDKKMMSYYSRFGLKASDARGFPGNIRQVTDAREIIEVQKFINPGQIQIFTLNKLDPKDMDMFVANVIREIFRGDPKEDPELKVILVFDEVHRLLSKFGGSGEGFLQIERACREFRKWGMGVMLVSQVLNDFVGEIKANISTEVQMRTRDEGDLGRIKIKYGESFLQSLVKASVGVGMFVNPAYNKGKPYFINFRPILHNTRRLSDEELEKYNKYNLVVDDIEYQVEQLEKEKIDVFDLKMELKLIKDKIMTGNFSVVDIYLEGLKPRIQKQWEKLGKKPKKLEKKLADLSEIKKSVEEAKKAREKFVKENKEKEKETPSEEKKEESPEEKLVQPLTFDNGLMVSSLKELKDILPNLDPEIFKIHVNDKKNDIAKWAENVSPDLAKSLSKTKEKSKVIEIIENFTKPKEKTTEEKKDSE